MFGSSDKSAPTCPSIDKSGPEIVPIVGNLTFHSLMMIIGGATALWASLLAIFLIFRHATHYSNPGEQKQIIRIATIVPTFAIICFFCVWFDGDQAPYIKGALDVAESVPLAAFFLLMVAYVCPDEHHRDAFFDQLELMNRRGKVVGPSSWKWFKRSCILVIQWIPASIILFLATDLSMAHGTYCETSNNVHFAHIWITVFRVICTFTAILTILKFYKRLRDILKPRGALKQLFCFKFIVFLNLIQTTVISFLTSGGEIKPTKYATYNDFANGLPCFLLCLELAIVAPLLLYAYPVKPYMLTGASTASGPSTGYYQGGPVGISALLQAINVFDLFHTFILGVSAHIGGKKPNPSRYPNTVPAQNAGYQYAPNGYGDNYANPPPPSYHMQSTRQQRQW